MKPKNSLQCSQQPGTELCLELLNTVCSSENIYVSTIYTHLSIFPHHAEV